MRFTYDARRSYRLIGLDDGRLAGQLLRGQLYIMVAGDRHPVSEATRRSSCSWDFPYAKGPSFLHALGRQIASEAYRGKAKHQICLHRHILC